LLAASFFVAPADPQATLSWSGYGPVRFGAPLSEVEKLLKEQSERDTGEPTCDYAYFKQFPTLAFMVEKGVITRADADPWIANSLDLALGAQLDEVRKKYPKAVIEPNHYDSNSLDIMIKSPDGKSAILLNEEKGRIVGIRAGLFPSVGYVERCL
jgi:hypothetical protein